MTNTTSNLPKWRGASVVYSKLYQALEAMARAGHVRTGRSWNLGRRQCYPSQDMVDVIDALDEGDEESLKGWLFQLRGWGYLQEKKR